MNSLQLKKIGPFWSLHFGPLKCILPKSLNVDKNITLDIQENEAFLITSDGSVYEIKIKDKEAICLKAIHKATFVTECDAEPIHTKLLGATHEDTALFDIETTSDIYEGTPSPPSYDIRESSDMIGSVRRMDINSVANDKSRSLSDVEQVISSQEQKLKNSGNFYPDVQALKQQLVEKDRYIEQLLVRAKCPTCGTVCGTVTGDQPDGEMEIMKMRDHVAGYEKYATLAMTYSFQDGHQQSNHPRPGTWYKGISRTAYLPYNEEGQKICAMLREAFNRRLVFTIGTSRTTGQEGVITWNDIHHKTDHRPNTQFGYPDPTYMARVTDELAAKGVTEEDIDKEFLKSIKTLSGSKRLRN